VEARCSGHRREKDETSVEVTTRRAPTSDCRRRLSDSLVDGSLSDVTVPPNAVRVLCKCPPQDGAGLSVQTDPGSMPDHEECQFHMIAPQPPALTWPLGTDSLCFSVTYALACTPANSPRTPSFSPPATACTSSPRTLGSQNSRRPL
jgi:hypothetical protein